MTEGTASSGQRWPWLVAVVIWLLFAVAMIAARGDAVSRLALSDSDDFTRLVQVENWLDGADWKDVTLRRMNPPDGVTMHWSRLPDVPIAAVMWVAELAADRETAATIALISVPLLYLLGFLLLVSRITHVQIGARAAALAPLIAAFAVPATGQFAPGRIDHHGLQILLTLVMLYGCIRVYADQSRTWPVVVGAAGALALAIGAEALPQLIAAYGALAVGWVLGRPGMARANLSMAAALAAGCALLLLTTVQRTPYFYGACDSLSLVYVVATGLAGSVWAILWMLDRRLQRPAVRGAALVLLSAVAGALVVTAYPQCAAGPYAALPPELTDSWLANVGEARSALKLAASQPATFILYFLLPVIGISVALRRIWRTPGDAQWWPVLVFLLVATAVALLQVRGGNIANAVAATAAPAFYHAVFEAIRRRARVLPILTAGIAVIILSPMTPLFIAPHLREDDAKFADGGLSCGLPESLEGLNRLRAGTIMSVSNLGPMILATTHHSVVGAPYHRNVEGLIDSFHFFEAQSDAEARSILARNHVDYLLYCLGEGPYGLSRIDKEESLGRRLIDGSPPPFLKRIPDDSLEIFRVTP
jgi:hypothetical protein